MDAAEVTGLVRRAAQGDQRAWQGIVDEYSGLVWSVARGFRLDEAQMADAVQTTWLRLVEHLAEIREPERLPGWLRTTTRRACLATARQSHRESPVDATEQSGASDHGGHSDDAGPEACAVRQASAVARHPSAVIRHPSSVIHWRSALGSRPSADAEPVLASSRRTRSR